VIEEWFERDKVELSCWYVNIRNFGCDFLSEAYRCARDFAQIAQEWLDSIE